MESFAELLKLAEKDFADAADTDDSDEYAFGFGHGGGGVVNEFSLVAEVLMF